MEGWSKIKLSDVCNIKKGLQLNKLDLESTGDYPCINGGILPSGYTHNWNTAADTITISEGGNSCGYVNFIKTNFWSGGHCYSLLELKEKINNDFLYFALKGREYLLMNLRVGSGLPNIQQKAIKEFEFTYPKSPTEQQKISEILSKVDKAITQIEALIAKYYRIKTGLMQNLLTKGIDINCRTLIQSDLKNIEINSGFYVTTLKSLTVVKQGYQIAISLRKKEDGPNRFIYITVQYINNPTKYLEYIDNPPKQVISDLDDILFTRTGNTGQIVTNIVGVYHNNFFRVDYNKKLILKDYLLHFLKWNPVKDLINELASTTTIPDLKHKDFYRIPIFFPKDKIEQKKIAAIINNADDVISQLNNELRKLQSLKTGLMQDLLSGKKRVTHLLN